MSGGAISGNRGGFGGSVYVSATFTMLEGATISGNTATYGGGVFVYHSIFFEPNGTGYGTDNAANANTAVNGGAAPYNQSGLADIGNVSFYGTAKNDTF
jgi:hypothetical protein